MNSTSRFFLLALLACAGLGPQVHAQEPAAPATPELPVAPDPVPDTVPEAEEPFSFERGGRRGNGDAVVAIGSDASLAAGQSTDAVVAIVGSASSDGDVAESIVSILGNTRVTGSVGESAVAILGDVYVNGRIGEQVVAVFGKVELGPEADVEEDVVVLGGSLVRDAAARVGGEIQTVIPGIRVGSFDWFRTWVKHCLLLGRPLALEPGLGWAWTLALGFLAFYFVLALLFGSSLRRCVSTLEQYPGRSLLASVLVPMLTPICIFLLIVTVIGIPAIPFFGIALFLAGLFGKAVMLAWIGSRGTRLFGEGPWNHPAIGVALGGAIVLALYLVPVIGFIVFNLLGMIGLGVVVYTLLLAWQEAHPPVAPVSGTHYAPSGNAPGDQPAGFTPASATMAGAAGEAPAPAATSAPAPAAKVAPLADATSLPRAGFWIRMGALLLDLVLIGTVLVFLYDPGSITLPLLAIYGAVMWKLKGTTVGGIVCGLKVVRLDGRPIDWPTAVVRALGCFLSLAVAGLGFIWVVFDEQKQSWHDKIAGTTVVRVPKGTSLV